MIVVHVGQEHHKCYQMMIKCIIIVLQFRKRDMQKGFSSKLVFLKRERETAKAFGENSEYFTDLVRITLGGSPLIVVMFSKLYNILFSPSTILLAGGSGKGWLEWELKKPSHRQYIFKKTYHTTHNAMQPHLERSGIILYKA